MARSSAVSRNSASSADWTACRLGPQEAVARMMAPSAKRAWQRVWRIVFHSLHRRHGHDGAAVTTQAWLWWMAGIAMALAVFAALAEHRRARRRDLDRVGIIPWNFIQVIAFLVAIVAAALALKV